MPATRVGPGGQWKKEREEAEAAYEAEFGSKVLYDQMARNKSGEALLNDKLIAAFEHLLLEGNTRSNTARILGVQGKTVAAWIRKGQKDVELGEATPEAQFTWMVDRCEGGQERTLVRAAMKVALAPTSDGTLALKLLERRNPEAWAPAIPEQQDYGTAFKGASGQALRDEVKRVLKAATADTELEGEVVNPDPK